MSSSAPRRGIVALHRDASVLDDGGAGVGGERQRGHRFGQRTVEDA
jgi:hypothetical protein